MRDLIETVENVLFWNLNEVFDSNIQVQWEQDGPEHTGTFSVGEATYEVLIRALAVDQYKILYLGFSHNGSFKLTNAHASPGKILGGAGKALAERIPTIEHDLIVFSALDKADKRIRIYSALADYFSFKQTEYRRIDLVLGSSKSVILSKHQDLTAEASKQIIKNLATAKGT